MDMDGTTAWGLAITGIVLTLIFGKRGWEELRTEIKALRGRRRNKKLLRRWEKERKGSTEDSIDPGGVFELMTFGQFDIYQRYINELFEKLSMEKKGFGDQWTKSEGDIIAKTAKDAQEEGINFFYIMTILETYIDADPLIRSLHRNNWVRTVTGVEKSMFGHKDSHFFPYPGEILSDVIKRFS